MIVSEFTRRFILYYNVSDDVWALNNPEGGTLFKRRRAAIAISRFLGDRVHVIRVSAKEGRIKRVSPYRASRGTLRGRTPMMMGRAPAYSPK